jgi:hypothetical protein
MGKRNEIQVERNELLKGHVSAMAHANKLGEISPF